MEMLSSRWRDTTGAWLREAILAADGAPGTDTYGADRAGVPMARPPAHGLGAAQGCAGGIASLRWGFLSSPETGAEAGR